MAAAGRKVEEVVQCRGMGEGEALARLVEAVTGLGDYKAVQVAHNRLQFARTFRPTWAKVAGWCTIWVVGLGALFFLVKSTETCVAVVETDHTGTRIRLTGVLSSEVLGRISSAFVEGPVPLQTGGSTIGAPSPKAETGPSGAAFSPPSANTSGAGLITSTPPSPVPTTAAPAPAAPAPVHSAAPASFAPPAPPAAPPAPGSIPPAPAAPAPAAPSPAMSSPVSPPTSFAPPAPPSQPSGAVGFDWGAAAAESKSVGDSSAGDRVGAAAERQDNLQDDFPDGTVAASVARAFANDPAALNEHAAVLDDGSVLQLGDQNLFGRDPVGDDERAGAQLFPIGDHSKSVSKTHFALSCSDGVWWIEDLHSTNGVSVVDASGTTSVIAPGERVRLADGRVVIQFGERTLSFGRQ